MHRTIDLRNRPPTGSVAANGSTAALEGPQQPLNPHAIAFLTCVSDRVQYGVCLRYLDELQVPLGYTVEKIAILGAPSMAEGYQRAMEASTARYKIYVHQDTYVVHRGVLPELLNLFSTYPRLGMIGVLGAVQYAVSHKWFANYASRPFGRIWECTRQGGLYYLLGRANRRRLYLTRFRSFLGDFQPAVAIDGPFMATQYDIPWINPLGGFMLYDQVQTLEFIKMGLEVGIARQEAVWCIHWGPLQERTAEHHRRRAIEYHKTDVAFRQLYQPFIGVPAQKLYEQYRQAAQWLCMVAGELGDQATSGRVVPKDSRPSNPAGERLGIIIATVNGGEAPVRALRALRAQWEAIKGAEPGVVVVGDAPIESTVEAVRRVLSDVTVIANARNGGLARGFNRGLRHLGFPNYVLLTQDDVEFLDGTLARMVRYLQEHSSLAGAIGSLTNPDGAVQARRTAKADLMPRRPRQPRRVTFVRTTCTLVRGEAFLDAGMYDERLDSYHKDLDWSLRAKRKGYRFASLPEAKVIHYQRERSRQSLRALFVLRFEGNLWYAYKHGGPRWAAVVYWAQHVLMTWVAFRWRNDTEALGLLNDARVRADELYSRVRAENQLPQLLTPE